MEDFDRRVQTFPGPFLGQCLVFRRAGALALPAENVPDPNGGFVSSVDEHVGALRRECHGVTGVQLVLVELDAQSEGLIAFESVDTA